MNKKCIWCGKRCTDIRTIQLESVDRLGSPTRKTFDVLPEHENKLRRYNKKLVKYGRTVFISALALPFVFTIFLILYFTFSFSERFMLVMTGLIITGLGTSIIIFPFATPETVRWLGLKKSIKLIRTLGILMILSGLSVMLLL